MGSGCEYEGRRTKYEVTMSATPARRRFGRLAALFCVLASAPVQAQVQLARLEGRVVDASGGAVGGAVVSIADPLGAELRRVVADAGGRFLFAELPVGRYALRASSGQAESWPVEVILNDALPVDVVVRVPFAFSDALVVEARRPNPSVASRASIGGDSLDRVPARTRSRGLQDAVATLPGWATEDNGLLHSRGVDDGFLYVIDGVPVYERIDQLFGIAPDLATIDALTVVTGFVPPEFGYKAGGVIDVRTRSAERPWRGSVRARGGQRGVVGLERKCGWSAGARRHGLAGRVGTADRSLPRPGAPGQLPQCRRRREHLRSAAREPVRARPPARDVGLRPLGLRRAEYRPAGGGGPGSTPARRSAVADRVLAADLVADHRVAGGRVRAACRFAPRRQRVRHANHRQRRPHAGPGGRSGLRHATGRAPPAQGGGRDPDPRSGRAVRLCRHRRGRGRGGRVERRRARARHRTTRSTSRGGRGRRWRRSTCRTPGRPRRD